MRRESQVTAKSSNPFIKRLKSLDFIHWMMKSHYILLAGEEYYKLIHKKIKLAVLWSRDLQSSVLICHQKTARWEKRRKSLKFCVS